MRKILNPISVHYFFVWMFCLIVKLYVVRMFLFHEYYPFKTMIIELPSVFLLSAIIELFFGPIKFLLFIFIDFLISILCIAVILYYQQFNHLVTYDALFQIGLLPEVIGSVSWIMKPGYYWLFVDIFVLIIVYLIRKNPMKVPPVKKSRLVLIMSVAIMTSSTVVYLHRKQSINLLRLSQVAGVLNAEVYSAYSEMHGEKLPNHISVSNDSIMKVKGAYSRTKPTFFNIAHGKNLIVIQLESFQNFLLGLRISGREVTPNLNRLMADSLVFPHFYTEIGEGNTSDAEVMTNASLYPLESGAIANLYGDRSFPSMPKYLSLNGYKPMTFHVGDIHYWNRRNLYPALGFYKYYDKSYFGVEDVIGMGDSDHVLYTKSLPILLQKQQKKEKFYAFYVTLSSHNPFIISPEKDAFPITTFLQGSIIGNYMRAAHYTDWALGEFFNTLQQNGLWDKSVIVLYGDHFAFVPETMSARDQKIMKTLLHRPFDDVEMLHTPLLIRVPHTGAQKINTIATQADLFPTLANLVGLQLKEQIHFGEDLLNSSANLFPIRYYLPKGSFFYQHYLYHSDTQTLEDIDTHKRVSNMAGIAENKTRIEKLEEMSDYYLKHLPKRTK